MAGEDLGPRVPMDIIRFGGEERGDDVHWRTAVRSLFRRGTRLATDRWLHS
jgi:hypothetical protein